MDSDEIESLLRETVETLGYELLELELNLSGRQRIVRLFLDSEQGIDLMDCEKVSQQVSAVLDVEDPISGEYELEVSSPGLNRKLFTEAHFERFRGAEAKIELSEPLDGRRRFRGRIDKVDGGNVRVLVDNTEFTLPISAIEIARLVPEF
ncbi:MAG: ribosome maturation factor RimP [Pseudomonadota bacterium]